MEGEVCWHTQLLNQVLAGGETQSRSQQSKWFPFSGSPGITYYGESMTNDIHRKKTEIMANGPMDAERDKSRQGVIDLRHDRDTLSNRWQ